MRLERLNLKNYRCFTDLSIELHPNLTVLIAPNGAGKTTILDAARVALWPFVKGFDLGSQTGKTASIQPLDVRQAMQAEGNMEPQLPSNVVATGCWQDNGPRMCWRRSRERITAGTNTLEDKKSQELTAFAKRLQDNVRNPERETRCL